MIITFFKSIIDNIKEKVKNPFIERNTTPFAGAFIIALILYNWQLFFSLFSFDITETRLTKINIIYQYIEQEKWYYRIGLPILYAFGSIVFFYLFNNISLGITTFFNRWFKATILYFTDRSKIITRNELQQNMHKMNILRVRHEELKKTFAESQSELEDYKKQIAEKCEELSKSNIEHDKINEELKNYETQLQDKKNQIEKNDNELGIIKKNLDDNKNIIEELYQQILDSEHTKKELEIINQKEKGFRILYAKYGKNQTFIEVTKKVIDLISVTGKFNADNESLGFDPLRFEVKELVINYSHNSVEKTLFSNEDEIVELINGSLFNRTTEKSIEKQLWIEKRSAFSLIFQGSWILKYSKDGKDLKEIVTIDKNGNYFSNGKHKFNLIVTEMDNNYISFSKIKINREEYSREKLKKINNSLFAGIDNLGYKLEYSLNENFNIEIAMNIALKDRVILHLLIEEHAKYQALQTSSHDNKIKKEYFTFKIINGNQLIFESFENFLKEHNIEYIDYQILKNNLDINDFKTYG